MVVLLYALQVIVMFRKTAAVDFCTDKVIFAVQQADILIGAAQNWLLLQKCFCWVGLCFLLCHSLLNQIRQAVCHDEVSRVARMEHIVKELIFRQYAAFARL